MPISRKDIKRFTYFDSGFVINLSEEEKAEVIKAYDDMQRKRAEAQAREPAEPTPELHI